MYRGDSPFGDAHFDADERVFLAGVGAVGAFPLVLGNVAVGLVSEVGAGVRGVAVGDRVAGRGPLREAQTWRWGAPGVYPGMRRVPEGVGWQNALCLDPAAALRAADPAGRAVRRVGRRVPRVRRRAPRAQREARRAL